MDSKSADEPIRERETVTRRNMKGRPERQQFDLIASSFQELFTLLEEYAPVWYTEQHHKRAVRAQRLLQKS